MRPEQIKESSLLSLAVSIGLLFGISFAGGLLYFIKAPSSSRAVAEERNSGNQDTVPAVPSAGEPSDAGSAGARRANSGDSGSAQGSDSEELSEDQKKKINVFGYDTQQRTAMVEFLVANNVAKLKANASALIVAGKLISAAREYGLRPDENNRIEFPEDSKFEQMFEEGTLINEIDIAKLPEVFVPLVEKYSKGLANPTEKKLAFFVLAAFYLNEIK